MGARWLRVTILEKHVVSGPDGPQESWDPVEDRWALVTPISSQARAEYQAVQSEVTHRVMFRGRVHVSLGDHRIVTPAGTLGSEGPTVLEPTEPPIDPGNVGRYTTLPCRVSSDA